MLVEKAVKFMMEILEWYGKFESPKMVNIYLSDHTLEGWWDRAYTFESCHIPVVIKGR